MFFISIQNVLEDYDVIVVIGSGGTASEIAIGNNYLTGSKLKKGLGLMGY